MSGIRKEKTNLNSSGRPGFKEFDPDVAPDNYYQFYWGLSREFIKVGEKWNHFIRHSTPYVYNRLVPALRGLTLDSESDVEEYFSQMVKIFWEEVWFIKDDPNYALDRFFSEWNYLVGEVKERRKAAELKARHDKWMEERYPDGEIKPWDKEGEKRAPQSKPRQIDRSIHPAKPSRHPLGGPRRAGELDDFSPRVREWLDEEREKREIKE